MEADSFVLLLTTLVVGAVKTGLTVCSLLIARLFILRCRKGRGERKND